VSSDFSLVNIKLKDSMGAKKRAKSAEDEFQSFDGLEGQNNHLQLPNLSNGSIADDVSK